MSQIPVKVVSAEVSGGRVMIVGEISPEHAWVFNGTKLLNVSAPEHSDTLEIAISACRAAVADHAEGEMWTNREESLLDAMRRVVENA